MNDATEYECCGLRSMSYKLMDRRMRWPRIAVHLSVSFAPKIRCQLLVHRLRSLNYKVTRGLSQV